MFVVLNAANDTQVALNCRFVASRPSNAKTSMGIINMKVTLELQCSQKLIEELSCFHVSFLPVKSQHTILATQKQDIQGKFSQVIDG